jgi:hypothetical protein
VAHAFWTPVRNSVIEFARRFRPSKDRVPPSVEAILREVDDLIVQVRWEEALTACERAADAVEQHGETRPKRVVGNKLLPLGDCGRGLRLLAEPALRTRAHEWQGEELGGRRLFVRQLHTSNMGAPIRMARFVNHAVERAAHVVVIVEPRLVPLLQRSFPSAEVRPTGGSVLADARAEDYVTSFEGLGGRTVTDWPSVEATFKPLRPDPAAVADLRARYASLSRGPLIGISWGSTNERKEVPELALWSQFIAAFPATFVSLQYGQIANALKLLRAGREESLIHDPRVDQFIDMDLFAAQVAAMDAVVTVTNTGAHLAGALGKPTLILIDNQVGRGYPARGERSWWYPDALLLRKGDRDWPLVMNEAVARLPRVLASRSIAN